MPIYEYICLHCGHETEVIQRFSDPPLSVCKNCSGHLEKKISVSSFHLKGSGWYVTDYARKNSGSSPSNPSAATSPEKGNGDGNGNGSKDSKSTSKTPAAAKSEAKGESKVTAGST